MQYIVRILLLTTVISGRDAATRVALPSSSSSSSAAELD